MRQRLAIWSAGAVLLSLLALPAGAANLTEANVQAPSLTAPDTVPQQYEEMPPFAPQLQRPITGWQSGPQYVQPPVVQQLPMSQQPPGATNFPVVLQQEIDSLHAHCGDRICARLQSPMQMGNQIFQPGSFVLGQVVEVDKARRNIAAELSTKRWLHSSGCVALEFDQIDDGSGSPTFIHALPVSIGLGGNPDQPPVKLAKGGKIEGKKPMNVKASVARSALGIASTVTHSPIVPLVGAAVGGLAPSMVLSAPDPVDDSTNRHRHLKGMATGAIAGLPGGSLINQSIRKGHNVMLTAGTVLILQLDGTAI